MLVTWMDHKKRLGLNMTFDDKKNKAMESFNYLKEREIGSLPDFVTSTGWFYKFKTHYGFHSIKSSYPDRLKTIIEEGYNPQQVFNMDETGLKWKKMLERMYITREEKFALGFKAFKDCFTHLLGVNLTGDCLSWRAVLKTLVHSKAMKEPACLSTGTPIPVVGSRGTFSRRTTELPW